MLFPGLMRAVTSRFPVEAFSVGLLPRGADISISFPGTPQGSSTGAGDKVEGEASAGVSDPPLEDPAVQRREGEFLGWTTRTLPSMFV